MSDTKGVLNTEVDDDFTLDDIEDMPGFVTPPTGAYTVLLDKGIEDLSINDENYYKVNMTLITIEEVQPQALDEGEELPKPGDIFGVIFKRNNAFGMDSFKRFVKPIAQRFDKKSVRDIKEVSKNLELMIILKRKYDSKKDRHNLEILKSEVI